VRDLSLQGRGEEVVRTGYMGDNLDRQHG
jgi:hypothetical protein